MTIIHSSFLCSNKTFDYSITLVDDKFFPYFKELTISLRDQKIVFIDNLSMADVLNFDIIKNFTNEKLDNAIQRIFEKTFFLNDIVQFIETKDTQYIQNIENSIQNSYYFDTCWSFEFSSFIKKEFAQLLPEGFPYSKALSYYLNVDLLETLDCIDENMFEYMFKIKNVTSFFIPEVKQDTDLRIHNFFSNLTIEKFKGTLKNTNFSYFIFFQMTHIIVAYFNKNQKRELFEFNYFLKNKKNNSTQIILLLNKYSPLTHDEFKAIFEQHFNVAFLSNEENFIDFLSKNTSYILKVIQYESIISKLPSDLVIKIVFNDILNTKNNSNLKNVSKFIFNFGRSISIEECKRISTFADKNFEDNCFLMCLFKNDLYDKSFKELSSIFNIPESKIERLIESNKDKYEKLTYTENLKNF